MSIVGTVVGTFDISGLCGCGSPCPDCCGNACCSGVPSTLYIQLANSVFCSGFDPFNSNPLIWNGTSWASAAFTVCDTTYSASLACNSGTALWELTLASAVGDCVVNIVSQVEKSHVCSPFHVSFIAIPVTDGATCTCCSANGQIIADITA